MPPVPMIGALATAPAGLWRREGRYYGPSNLPVEGGLKIVDGGHERIPAAACPDQLDWGADLGEGQIGEIHERLQVTAGDILGHVRADPVGGVPYPAAKGCLEQGHGVPLGQSVGLHQLRQLRVDPLELPRASRQRLRLAAMAAEAEADPGFGVAPGRRARERRRISRVRRDRRLTGRQEDATRRTGGRPQGRSLATRNPTLMSENPTGFLTRLAGRLARGRLSQEPPRIMR